VYLGLSVLAGALSAVREGWLPALLAGLGFAGVFLAASAVAIGWRKALRRLLLGLALALLAPAAALALGADPTFFAFGLLALFPAGISAWFAELRGFQSPIALALGITALVVAAPSAACAGGADLTRSLVLLALLLPFFIWRALRILGILREEKQPDRSALRRRGQREAFLAVGWTFLAVVVIHLIP